MVRNNVSLTTLLALMLAIGAEAAVPASERQARVALYESTTGPQWLDQQGWLGASGSECDWTGITCNGSESAIVRIALPQNYLEGMIPPQIGDFSQLEELVLSRNYLSGQLPAAIGQLTICGRWCSRTTN